MLGKINSQQGFTLIEVMIAAFVLSVGMLGSTAMMLRGHQEADRTNYEGLAVQLATNMSERMRGNIQGVEAGSYNGLAANASDVHDCSASYCDSATVALYHAYIWGQELEDLMPNTNATATVRAIGVAGTDTVFGITVNWDASVRTSTDTQNQVTKTYTMIFQP